MKKFLTGGNSTMKNKMIIKFIVSILLAYLMVYIIDSLLSNSNLSQPGIDHIVILDFIFASCIVIIALIIIFALYTKYKNKNVAY